jgi:hypothetical protein
MRSTVITHAFLLGLLALAACTTEPEDSVAKAPPGATTPSAGTPEVKPAPTPAPLAKPEPVPAQKKETPPAVPTLNKLAPDIVGEDIDGRPLKLSDYRGKVVMLDFWGHW